MVVVVGTEFLNDTMGGVGGCLDYRLQRTIPLGDYYYTHSCEICLCSVTQRMCKQVACAPPNSCPGYIKKDPKLCCDICVPLVVERPNPEGDREGLSLRLGVGTLFLFLLLSLILFAFHRLRKKRLLFTLRRFREMGRLPLHDSSYSSTSSDGQPRSLSALTIESTTAADPDGAFCVVNGYAFPGAPPPYQEAVVSEPSPQPPSPATPAEAEGSDPAPPYVLPTPDESSESSCSSSSSNDESSCCSCTECDNEPDEPEDPGPSTPPAVEPTRRKKLKKFLFRSRKCKRNRGGTQPTEEET